jgi:hypothetical protein
MVMDFTIEKSTGQREKFEVRKLAESLIRSGAPPDVASEIAQKVARQMPPAGHTKAVYRMAKRLLRQYSAVSGMKYSLKKALSALGPSGYPFEKYFARILRSHGYKAETNKIMKGYCVSHEVDVVAVRGNEYAVVECKYHINGGTPTDVKVALYVHSRFEDIRKVFARTPGEENAAYQGWLVTNTRCTSDAIQYAACAGLKIVSWRYPAKESLEKMIEERKLYPVTVLPAARKKALDVLFNNDIILAQEIADMDEKDFLRRSGLDAATAKAIKRQADALCPCG